MTTYPFRMNNVRHTAAGAHHESLGFLVSGGRTNVSTILSSSELSTNGATWGVYTQLQLPIGLRFHCMIALDRSDGEFFLAGGSDARDGSNSVDLAFIYNGTNWVEVTPMPTARYGTKS